MPKTRNDKKNTKNNTSVMFGVEQPFFNFKAEAQDRWNRRKGNKKTFVRW